jgi:hypothetical protein
MKTTVEQQAALEAAKLEYETAKTTKDWKRISAAWAALEVAHVAVHGPQKRSGFASRAGRRQAAERRSGR